MLIAGELDATLLYFPNTTRIPNLIDRSTADLWHHPDIKPIFPDPAAEGVRFYKKTGLYPINHGMVIKREIAEKHPWAVLNLLKAFEAARQIADHERIEHLEYYIECGMLPKEAQAAVHEPIIRHGIRANRKILEAAAQYSQEQSLTPRLMRLDEIFAASTMEQ
jgi:4,5-dihydroxyphthalate decarboxylase